MLRVLKHVVRRTLGRFGYALRQSGYRGNIAGVDLIDDVHALLHGKSNAVLFDVGANVGQTLGAFLDIFSSPRIVSFEPSPVTFESLRKQYGDRSGIQVENIALSDREATQDFYVTRTWSVNDSLLRPTWNDDTTAVSVRVETLDGYCQRQGIDMIDFLKVDTQGNDLNVLRGAQGLLSSGSIHFVAVEVLFMSMYEQQPRLADFLAFADTAGYRLVGFYEQTFVDNQLNHLNALFERAREGVSGRRAAEGS